jgi:hypothetical protein
MFMATAAWPQTNASIKQRFKSKNYTVTWGVEPRYPTGAQLEIGYGNGHGGGLAWLRLRPVDDGVEVLSIELDEGWHPYKSKWQLDVVPVVVKRGRITGRAYTSLLKAVATVSSARLKRVNRNSVEWASSDFWVATRVSSSQRILLDFDWAGYSNSVDEPDYAKPEIAVALAREALAKTKLDESSLSPTERRWASTKFVEDWRRLAGRQFYWWVAERLIRMVGVIGDDTALATLAQIAGRNVSGGPDDRRIYYAINAITRLTGKDVRPRPVEEMDLEPTRHKVLQMLKDRGR